MSEQYPNTADPSFNELPLEEQQREVILDTLQDLQGGFASVEALKKQPQTLRGHFKGREGDAALVEKPVSALVTTVDKLLNKLSTAVEAGHPCEDRLDEGGTGQDRYKDEAAFKVHRTGNGNSIYINRRMGPEFRHSWMFISCGDDIIELYRLRRTTPQEIQRSLLIIYNDCSVFARREEEAKGTKPTTSMALPGIPSRWPWASADESELPWVGAADAANMVEDATKALQTVQSALPPSKHEARYYVVSL